MNNTKKQFELIAVESIDCPNGLHDGESCEWISDKVDGYHLTQSWNGFDTVWLTLFHNDIEIADAINDDWEGLEDVPQEIIDLIP